MTHYVAPDFNPGEERIIFSGNYLEKDVDQGSLAEGHQ